MNPKQREESPLHGKIGLLCVTCMSLGYSHCYEEIFFSLEQLPDTQEGDKWMK